MSFSSMGEGGGGALMLFAPPPLHDFKICFQSFQAKRRRTLCGRIRSTHSGVRLKIMNRVVKKRTICADRDIIHPNCSKNALLPVSTRSHVILRNFSFSSVREGRSPTTKSGRMEHLSLVNTCSTTLLTAMI